MTPRILPARIPALLVAFALVPACAGDSPRGRIGRVASELETITLSEEFPVDHPMSRETDWAAGVVAGPNGYLAFGRLARTYSDLDPSDLVAARITPDGTVVDPSGIVVATGTDENASHPFNAVHAGSHWVVLYRRGQELLCTRLLEDGTRPDLEGRSLGIETVPEHVSYGGAKLFVLGSDGRAAIVDPNCASATPPFAVAPVSADLFVTTSLSFDGSNFVVGYSTKDIGFPDRFVVQKVSPAGSLVGAPIQVATASWSRTTLDTAGVYGVRGRIASESGKMLATYASFTWDPVARTGTRGPSSFRAIDANGLLGEERSLVPASSWPNVVPAGDGFLLTATNSTGRPLLVKVRPDGTEVRRIESLPGIVWVSGPLEATNRGTDLLVLTGGLLWRYTGELTQVSGPTPINVRASHQWNRSLASTGDDRLVVWDEPENVLPGRASNPGFGAYGSRVTSDGTILDAEPRLLYETTAWANSAASNGRSFLVTTTHSEAVTQSLTTQRLEVRWISANGELASNPVVLGRDAGHVAVTSDGNNYLVAWSYSGAPGEGSELLVARVSADGTLIDTTPRRAAESPIIRGIAAAYDGEGYLVAFDYEEIPTGRRVIRLARITRDASDFEVETTPWSGWLTGLEWGEEQGLLTYFGGGTNPNYVAMIPRRGGVLDASSVTISTTAAPADAPVAWDGTNFWVAWHDMRRGVVTSSSTRDVYVARFSPNGEMLDPLGMLVTQGDLNRRCDPNVALASERGRVFATYSRWDTTNGTRACRVQGRVLSSSPNGGTGGAGGDGGIDNGGTGAASGTGGRGGSTGTTRGGSAGAAGTDNGSGAGGESGDGATGSGGDGGHGATGSGGDSGEAGSPGGGAAGSEDQPAKRASSRRSSDGCSLSPPVTPIGGASWLLCIVGALAFLRRRPSRPPSARSRSR